MAKGAHQKLKLLYMADIFLKETDEEHGLTVPQITEKLSALDVSVERKTIYNDFEQLSHYGIEIQKYQNGHDICYYTASRRFELPELKLLVDSVQSSKFITEKKSADLIKKLEEFTSIHNARQLQRQVIISGRVKTINERIYYSVDDIHTAISGNVQITFRYCQWNVRKEVEPRHDGSMYQVSPWALVWDDENYYLVAYDSKDKILKHFRVDKMINLSLTDIPREGREEFEKKDLALYNNVHFGMFGGKEEDVSLLCKNDLIGVIIDRFGTDIPIIPRDNGYCVAHVKVVVSNQFLGWVFGIGGGIKILSPKSVVDKMREEASRLVEQYNEF